MTRISHTDQVLLLLHEQLGRMTRERAARGAVPSRAEAATPEPVARLRALAGRDHVSEEELKRALVRGLLTQQLGEAIGGDPAFEAVTADVLRIIADTPEGQALLDQALGQLSPSAG